MLNKVIFLFTASLGCIVLILSSFVHPELITEQFGVISRERTCIFDHLILISMLIMLGCIMAFNIYNK